jgi:hypothetical protein
VKKDFKLFAMETIKGGARWMEITCEGLKLWMTSSKEDFFEVCDIAQLAERA